VTYHWSWDYGCSGNFSASTVEGSIEEESFAGDVPESALGTSRTHSRTVIRISGNSNHQVVRLVFVTLYTI